MASLSRRNFSILVVLIFVGIVIFRLAYLQVVHGSKYHQISKNNFLKEVLVPSPRGEILDRFGRKIAISKPIINLYMKVNVEEESGEIKDFLVNKLNLDKKTLKKIRFEKSPYISKRILLKKDLDINEIYKLESYLNQFESLELLIDYLRVYPYGEVGAHKIGYLRTNDKRDLVYGSFLSSRSGASGLEKKYDRILQGNMGAKYLLVDNKGREIDSDEENITTVERKRGSDLSLTIDIELEKLIYEAFGKLNGAAMVHDLNTGEILALVSKPSFDPNLFAQPISSQNWKQLNNDKARPFMDRALLATSPPGSIIKIVTAAAALEEKVITKDTKLNCPGSIDIGGRRFRDWLKGGHGTINVKQALIGSSDVFFYQVGLKLGIKRYSKWLEKFKIGRPSDLPFAQNPGTIPNKKFIDRYLKGKFYPGDMANVSIGQGYLTMNVVQASIMTSIIASNGYVPNLYIVKSDDVLKKEKVEIRESTLKTIQEGLLGVVNDKKGTGFHARDDGRLAGKTGTAQVISKDARQYGYGKFRNHGWFTAYYPYNNPQIVISVFAEHGSSGGAAGGPIIKKIVRYYKANYLKEKPKKDT